MFAAKLGITKGWLSLIERGIVSPGSLRLGHAIEQLTGIAADEWPTPERRKRRSQAA